MISVSPLINFESRQPFSRRCFATTVSPSFAQTDPWIGTWQSMWQNPRTTALAVPRAVTATYESVPGGYRVLVEAVDAQGRQLRSEWPVIFDGRRHRVTGSPATDEIADRRIDPYTQQEDYFKGGQPDGTATFVISRDGRIITRTSQRLLPNGRESIVVEIYEKQ
jgi:hypothetical protein